MKAALLSLSLIVLTAIPSVAVARPWLSVADGRAAVERYEAEYEVEVTRCWRAGRARVTCTVTGVVTGYIDGQAFDSWQSVWHDQAVRRDRVRVRQLNRTQP